MKNKILTAVLLVTTAYGATSSVLEKSLSEMKTSGRFNSDLTHFLLSEAPVGENKEQHEDLRGKLLEILYGKESSKVRTKLQTSVETAVSARTISTEAPIPVRNVDVVRPTYIRITVGLFKAFIKTQDETTLLDFANNWSDLNSSEKETFFNNLADHMSSDLASYPKQNETLKIITADPKPIFDLMQDLAKVSKAVRAVNRKNDQVPDVKLTNSGNWDVNGTLTMELSLMVPVDKEQNDGLSHLARKYTIELTSGGTIPLATLK